MSLLSTLRRTLRRPFERAGRRAYNRDLFADFLQHERMLADRPRMDFYHAAISRHVRPGDRVIDLGTGTGVLATFAARSGAGHVHALDHSPVIEQARRLASAHNLQGVEFISRHSSKFTPPEPADLIIHEQMGNCLFDEGMLASVCDLRDRALRPGGRILPARFEFFCEPVRLRERDRVPHLWEFNVHGFDCSPLRDQRPRAPAYRRLRLDDPAAIECFLGQPAPLLTFDLHTVDPASFPRELLVRRPVLHPGRLDGYAVFFRALVDDDLRLSTHPLDLDRAVHWGIRLLRVEARDFAPGSVVETTLAATDWGDLGSWSW